MGRRVRQLRLVASLTGGESVLCCAVNTPNGYEPFTSAGLVSVAPGGEYVPTLVLCDTVIAVGKHS